MSINKYAALMASSPLIQVATTPKTTLSATRAIHRTFDRDTTVGTTSPTMTPSSTGNTSSMAPLPRWCDGLALHPKKERVDRWDHRRGAVERQQAARDEVGIAPVDDPVGKVRLVRGVIGREDPVEVPAHGHQMIVVAEIGIERLGRRARRGRAQHEMRPVGSVGRRTEVRLPAPGPARTGELLVEQADGARVVDGQRGVGGAQHREEIS